jgi:hypothetical protein
MRGGIETKRLVQKNISVPEWPDEWNQTKEDFMTDIFVADRSVQVAKLKIDLQVATSGAELTGVPLIDIIMQLLQRADDLCRLGSERGLDLSRVGDIFRGDGE